MHVNAFKNLNFFKNTTFFNNLKIWMLIYDAYNY